jgi:hypothetical protein
MKINKGLKNPPMPAKGTVKRSDTPAEVKMMSNMIQAGEVPTEKELEIMNSYFPGGFAAKEYTDLAKSRVENNYTPTRAPKYLSKKAKMLVKKLKR